MPVARHVPMYLVWEDLNQTETDGSMEWGAINVEDAARCHARKMEHEEPFETFPRDFMVIDPAGVRWRVSVDRVIEYDYRGTATKENQNARRDATKAGAPAAVRAGADDRQRAERPEPHAAAAAGRAKRSRGDAVHSPRVGGVRARARHRDGGGSSDGE